MNDYDATVVATCWFGEGDYQGVLWAQQSHSLEETRALIFSDILRLIDDFDNDKDEVRICTYEDAFGEQIVRAIYNHGGIIDYSCVFQKQNKQAMKENCYGDNEIG